MSELQNPLTDAELDEIIRATLAVEPSSELATRVRNRVANQPIARSHGWMWTSGVAAAASVAGLALYLATHERVAPVPPANITATTSATTSAPAREAPSLRGANPVGPLAPAPSIAVPRSRPAPPTVESEPEMARAPGAEPDVLFSQEEIVAFHEFLRSPALSRVDMKTLATERPPATVRLPELPELSIALVVVEPLAPLTN